MKKSKESTEVLRAYAQPSIRFFHIGISVPVCVSVGATTEDYVEDDVFSDGNN